MNQVVRNALVERLAQSTGRHPFEVVLSLTAGKRRRALLRGEALRQLELSALARERLLRAGDLWAPAPGTRLAREWQEAVDALRAGVAGLVREGGHGAV